MRSAFSVSVPYKQRREDVLACGKHIGGHTEGLKARQ